jgi:hypothetical protein
MISFNKFMKNQNVCTNPAYSITAQHTGCVCLNQMQEYSGISSKLFPGRIVSRLSFKFDGGKQQSLNFGLALTMNI